MSEPDQGTFSDWLKVLTLAQEAHLTLANASAHLQVLRRARLVEAVARLQKALAAG